MSFSNSPRSLSNSPHPLDRRGLIRWAFKQCVFLFILFAALFFSAGRYDSARAWSYFGLVAFIQVLTAVILIPRSPELLIERSQLKGGAKTWDICLAVLIGYSSALMALAAGMERRSTGFSAGLDMSSLIGITIALVGTSLTLWAMLENPFFSGIVRIQLERGHTVASTGPYRYIRHPGYAGMLVFTFATPLILGSWWSLWVALLVTALTILRTALEDRTLQLELSGYAAYAQRARYRLVPGIW